MEKMKKSNVKKIMTMFLVMIMVLTTVLAGCGKSKDTTTNTDPTKAPTKAPTTENTDETDNDEPQGFVFGSEPVEFSYYVNYDWYQTGHFGNTVTTQWLQENKLLNIVEISANNAANQKFGTMIAANDLPDLIQLDRGAQFNQLADEGYLVALDDFINNPAYPNVKALFDEETLNMVRSADGKIYGLPNWFDSSKNPVLNGPLSGWIVNKKIYAELGSPKIETFDDLYDYLVKVKANYPGVVPLDTGNTTNGNVQVNSFIRLGMSEGLINGAIQKGVRSLDRDTFTFTSVFEDEAYKETWALTNKLFREKLLTQDTFTQTIEQFREKLNTGKIAVAAISDFNANLKPANAALKAEDPEAGYMVLPLLVKEGVNPENVKPHGRGTIGWNLNCITIKCKDPEKAFAYFDWMLSDEGQATQEYGPEGLLWDWVDGIPAPNDHYDNATPDEMSGYAIGNWKPIGSWKTSYYARKRAELNPDSLDDMFEAMQITASGLDVKVNNDQFNGVGVYEVNSKEELSYQRMENLLMDYAAKLVFASSDSEFETAFENFKRDAEKAGYADLLAYDTATWQANAKKMGIIK